MAYSGTGTQADPYIVDNWADFCTAINAKSDCFVKWADKDDPSEKIVPAVSISSAISWRAIYVDFNQWTFEEIAITYTYSTSRKWIFNNQLASIDATIYNWHVLKFNVKDCQCGLFAEGIALYSCFFDEVYCDSLSDTSDFWKRNATTTSSKTPGPRLLGTISFHESIIHTNTSNVNMIVPSGQYFNSEIWINYKYDKTDGTKAYKSRSCVFWSSPTLHNTYLGGVVDVADGSGSFTLTDPKNAGTAQQAEGAYLENSIINLQYIVSSSCTIDCTYAPAKFLSTGNDIKSYFVIDNGNDAEAFSSVIAAFKCTLADIKSDSVLLNDQFPHIEDDNVRYPQYSYDRSSENWIWHWVEDVNNAIPFLPFWYYPTRLIPRYDTDRGYISVYDISEPQNGYDHNGLAVLFPSEIISTKEEKGRWDIEIIHPIDQWGKWTYIVGQNVVKVNGQLFRIDEVETYLDADSEYVSAHAKHITYDMSDVWINEANFTADGGSDYYIKLYASRVRDFPNQQHVVGEYVFNVTSDITGAMECALEDQNLTEALFGADNSFINRYGGELYRDNFNITINQHLEGADNAFSIRYGTDLTKISFKIDFSQWITNLICVDNFGSLVGVWYDTSGDWIVHHHKTKRVHFTYAELVDPDYAIERLDKDTMNLWAQVSTPIISIEIKTAAIKNDPKYKDFLNLQNFDVGYSGQIYVEHLGIDVSMKIVSIRRNELTGEAISITLGNSRGSLIRQTVLSQTIVPNNSIEAKQEAAIAQVQQDLFDTNTTIMAQSIDSMEDYAISDIEKRTIVQLEG